MHFAWKIASSEVHFNSVLFVQFREMDRLNVFALSSLLHPDVHSNSTATEEHLLGLPPQNKIFWPFSVAISMLNLKKGGQTSKEVTWCLPYIAIHSNSMEKHLIPRLQTIPLSFMLGAK
ncbi:unnamed protein product [Cuscuta europaea]|uniref:Uncharacterized protein n=1 Tax=Cuscuta europaea TaxID=41803 RepID=A0A9P1EA67_CUSEU|nr:unnamed protein product [Cuscuta europaea]